MKKLLLFVSSLALLSATASAQVTLNQSNYNNAQITGTDSLHISDPSTTYPNLSAQAGATWDMTTMTYLSTLSYLNRTAGTLGSAQYATAYTTAFGIFSYNAEVQSSLTNNGIVNYGETMNHQAFSLYDPSQPITQPSDSLVIDAQNIMYSSPETVLAFPATYQSMWNSSYNFQVGFHITLNALSYNNAQGSINAHVSRTDKVVGYGQMRVTDAQGNPTGYNQVLQVQTTEYIADSFFINGQPALSLLLQGFNLSQGMVDSSYQENFYRMQDITPMATANYSNGSFSGNPDNVTTASRNITTGIANVSSITGVKVYPNPAVGYTVSVDIPGGNHGNWSYELVNISGQTVAASTFSGSSVHNTLTFNQQLTPGIYYLKMTSTDGSELVRPLDLQK